MSKEAIVMVGYVKIDNRIDYDIDKLVNLGHIDKDGTWFWTKEKTTSTGWTNPSCSDFDYGKVEAKRDWLDLYESARSLCDGSRFKHASVDKFAG